MTSGPLRSLPPSSALSRGAGDGASRTAGGNGAPRERLSGDHWWDPDRERHVRDRPRYCPGCGHGVGEDDASLSVEYWEADRRVYRLWCRSCGWTGDIVKVDRAEGHEPSH